MDRHPSRQHRTFTGGCRQVRADWSTPAPVGSDHGQARPFFDGEPPSWWYTEESEPNSDTWAAADESREQIVGLYHQAWEHSNSTIAALPLDTIGHVPWWPQERREVTLNHILVRVISDTQRHAVTPISCESSSTDPSAICKAKTTCHQVIRRGGRATGADWSAWRGKSMADLVLPPDPVGAGPAMRHRSAGCGLLGHGPDVDEG